MSRPLIVADFDERLLMWAESLTAEERAQARLELERWCEAGEIKRRPTKEGREI
jgi:hypothetical protein